MSPSRQRRTGLMLAGVATLGWALAIAFAWFNASIRTQHQAELRRLEAARKTPGGEIAAKGPTTNALADPQQSASARPNPERPAAPAGPKAEIDPASRSPVVGSPPVAYPSSEASASPGRTPASPPVPGATQAPPEPNADEIARVRRDLEAAQERLAAAQRAYEEATRRLQEKEAQIEDAERRLSAARSAAALAENEAAARAEGSEGGRPEAPRHEAQGRLSAPPDRIEGPQKPSASKLRRAPSVPASAKAPHGPRDRAVAVPRPRAGAWAAVATPFEAKRRFARVGRKAEALDRRIADLSAVTEAREARLIGIERRRVPKPRARQPARRSGWMIAPSGPVCPRW